MISQLDWKIDAFCGIVGTAGMIMGAGEIIRDRWSNARIVALEPDTSAVLSGQPPGPHSIDGTGAGFIPPQFSRDVVTDVMAIPESEARILARRLAREEGIFAGTSSGANLYGALALAREIGRGGTVVTVACDSGYKYLMGGLFS